MMFWLVVRNRQVWTVLMVSVLLLGSVWTWQGRVVEGNAEKPIGTAPRPNMYAPNFTLGALNETNVSLDDYRGHGVIVNFWATWCLPCRTEMPALERTWATFKDQGLVILAVNLQESPEQVAEFADEFGLTFPILLDRDGSVFGLYNVQLYPTTFFIGRDGIIRDLIFGGPMAETLIASKAAELLEE